MTSHSKNSIANIQALRGLAALSVVMAHASEQFVLAPQVPHINAGKAGVDLFFVISGFIMVFVTAKRSQTGLEFLKNRVIRIVPNYWFYTFWVAILGVAVPSVFRHTETTTGHLLMSLSFIAHRNPAMMQSTSPLLRPGWTLNYEMFFYLIFALAMMNGGERRVRNATIAIVGLAILGAVMTPGAILSFYTRGIMIEFVFGMLLAKGYLHGFPELPKPAIGLACVAAVACLCVTADYAENHALRFLFFGVPALIIVASSLMLENEGSGRSSRILCRIGDASYALYLSHPLAVGACRALLTKLHLSPHSLAEQLEFMLLASVVAICCALPAYRYIELPLTELARSIFERSRAHATVAAA